MELNWYVIFKFDFKFAVTVNERLEARVVFQAISPGLVILKMPLCRP